MVQHRRENKANCFECHVLRPYKVWQVGGGSALARVSVPPTIIPVINGPPEGL